MKVGHKGTRAWAFRRRHAGGQCGGIIFGRRCGFLGFLRRQGCLEVVFERIGGRRCPLGGNVHSFSSHGEIRRNGLPIIGSPHGSSPHTAVFEIGRPRANGNVGSKINFGQAGITVAGLRQAHLQLEHGKAAQEHALDASIDTAAGRIHARNKDTTVVTDLCNECIGRGRRRWGCHGIGTGGARAGRERKGMNDNHGRTHLFVDVTTETFKTIQSDQSFGIHGQDFVRPRISVSTGIGSSLSNGIGFRRGWRRW